VHLHRQWWPYSTYTVVAIRLQATQVKIQNVTWASEMMLSIIFLTLVNSCWRSWSLGMSYSGVKYGWLRTSSAPKLPGSTFWIFCSTTRASLLRSWRHLTTSAPVVVTMTIQEVDMSYVIQDGCWLFESLIMIFGSGTSHGRQTDQPSFDVNWEREREFCICIPQQASRC